MSVERDMLSPREVAERVGLSYHAVLRAIKRGDLEACEPVPGRLRIDVEEYDRWRRQPSSTPRHVAPTVMDQRRARARSSRAGSFASELRAIEGGC